MPQTTRPFTLDPYTPAAMARKADAGGLAKVRPGAGSTLALSVLAGAFIAPGAMFSTVVATDTGLGVGPTRLLASWPSDRGWSSWWSAGRSYSPATTCS